MYVHVKPSIKQRVLSFFMAFAIIFVSLPYVDFEASATPTVGNGRIIQVQTYSKYMGQSGYTESHGSDGTSNGIYTGKILPQSVNMYDYLTDYEKNNNQWNNLSGNYNNYTYFARYEPYKQLNRAISAETTPRRVISSHENNVTIVYKSIPFSNDEAWVHLWNDSDAAVNSDKQMTLTRTDGNVKTYKLTVSIDDLGFTPNSFIFSNGKSSGKVETDTVSYSVTAGREYTFSKSSTDDKITVIYWPGYENKTYNLYYWNGSNNIKWPGPGMTEISRKKYSISIDPNNNEDPVSHNNIGIPQKVIFSENGSSQTADLKPRFPMEVGYSFSYMTYGTAWDIYPTNFNVADTGVAEDIIGADMPKLYQGYFLASNGDDSVDNNVPSNYTDGRKPENKSNGIITDNQKYTDFYWSANMAQRPVSDNQNLPKASVTKLVDEELNDDDLVAQGTTALPYFDSSWSGVSNGLMKCWEGTADKSIAFPFYEVLTNAKDAAGGDSSTTQKATFYQFNSKDSTLHFEYNNSTPKNSYFEERQPAVVNSDGTVNGDQLNESIRASNGKVGFFPYNDGASGSTNGDSYIENTETNRNNGTAPKSGYKNNYGFGAKFEMTFKLSKDGKTSATHDSSNNKLASDVTPTKVNTRFEFNGDDDLWVFIDGNLVLDMGGAHSASYGYIDFAQKTAYAANAIEFDSNNSGLGQNGTSGITELSGTTFLSKIDGSQNVEGNYYNENTLHTMTIFYMERGMSESNLFIRFNFAAEANYNKLKVKEQTDFSSVNAGLKDLTKIAADTDVFKYKIENKGTNSDYVLQINTPFPTLENYVRQITGDQTNKTKLASATSLNPTSNYFDAANIPADQPDSFQLVKNTNYNWVDEYALNSSGEKMDSSKLVSGKTDSNGFMYLMYGTTKDDNTDGKERKSSGEFEDQFTRYSMMRITQQTDLRTPNSHDVESSDAAALLTDQTDPARTTTAYYNLKESYIFSTTHLAHVPITNGQQFKFRNTIIDADPTIGDNSSNKDEDKALKSKVSMTAQFVNEPKTGAITITKAQPSGDDSVDDEFTIKIRFEDIFGVTGVNADTAADYSGIVYKRYSTDSGRNLDSGSDKLTAGKVTVGGVSKDCGTFKLKVGETAYIENIPVGTKYYIYEEEPKYKPDPISSSGTVEAGRFNTTSHKTEKLISTDPDTYDVASSNNNVTVTNYSNSLTIKEVTDFSTVNSGLLTYTKKAAENDVFKYTVSNEGTSSSDVVDSGIKTPTYDQYKRINNGETTTLTYHAPVPDTTHIYLDTSKALSGGDTWSSHDAIVGAYIYNSGSGGHTVLGEYVSENLYKFDIAGYSKVYFKRFSPGTSISSSNNSDISADWGNQNDCRITFQQGATYKVDSWSQTILKTSTPVNLYPTESHNYTPSVSGNTVANTNYEWTDEFASPATQFSGTTGNNGEFYLMHGTEVYTKNSVQYTQDKESSAKFYNQFARGSTMTVEQDGTLTSPNGGTPDTLKANNQRGEGTSRATYYTTTKTLEGSTTSNSLTDNVLPTGTNDFAFNNGDNDLSIHITETFTNSINTGTLKISKEIDPTETTNDTQTNAEFTFKITLTKVFGVTNNNVLNGDYDDIIVKKNSNSYTLTPATNSSNNYATFTLNVGDVLTIEKIPVGTHYVIEELSNDDSTEPEYNYELNKIYKKVDTSSTTGSYTEQTGATTITGDIVSGETHDFKVANKRKTGSLTVSKSLIGDDNNTNVNSNTKFYFKVQLTKPDGVTLNSTNYPITCTNGTYDYGTNSVIVTATSTTTATISGIPYGTGYTVTEVADSAGDPISNDTNYPNVVYDNKQSGTINSPSTVETVVKNIYRKISLEKEDSKDNTKKLNGATYYLLKLNSKFDTDYTANPTAVENIFKSAVSYTDDGTNDTVNLKQYYSGYSGTLTTADLNGFSLNDTVSITLNDSNVTHGITAGKYFLFEETAPNNNYERDNSFTYTDSNNQTHSKIITVQDTDDNPTYSVTYGDPRKTGKIVINKELFEGTDATTYGDTEFTFNVTLDGTNGDGTGSHLDLSKYGITEKINNVSSATTLTYNSSTHKYTGTITVTKNAPVTIENIPYGTSYSISEAPTGQWKKISEIGTPALSGTINVDLPNVSNIDTATITTTNALTGTLQLSKALTGAYNANGKNTTDSFYFDVTLITPDDISQSTLNSIVSGATFTQDATNTRKFTSTVSVQGNSTPVSVSGLPYGTTYAIVEADESQSKTETITYALNGTAGAITNKTIGAANVVTTTNNYPELGSLEVSKTTIGDDRPADQSFTFTVTLTPQSGTLIDLEDFNFTYDGTKATLSTDHKTFTVTLQGGESLNISGIPVGTGYSVAESTPPSGWELTSQTGESGTISTTLSTAIFTNTFTRVYKTVILQKVDASRNNALITSSPATFKLLRLPNNNIEGLQNAITNGTVETYATVVGTYTTGTTGTITISEQDIAFGDDYFFFYEVSAPEGYHTDNSVTSDKIFKVDADEVVVRYSNTPDSTSVTVIKRDKATNAGLENAEFELWYKDVKMPSTYSINKSVSKPLPSDSVQINTSTKPSAPADAAGESTTTPTYTENTSYTDVAAPDAEETEWILPRTDNDYVYFRDYNTGTLHTGDSGDKGAFGNNEQRSWINTWFGYNDHGQSEELMYDGSYQIEAQFTKENNDNDMVKYNVWERFVEDYSNNGGVCDAVVWKIQPPDGYHYVRFCLKQNGTYLRTTTKINYKLGCIYTKNGISYKDARWNYPVSEEQFSTYYTTPSTNGTKDKRLSTTTEMYQADRYTATPQKIIFHCNSKKVWHNIHIEFFTNEDNGASTVSEAGSTYYYVGQKAPGYMMEPYAYAGDDYRVNGYLTYELTIPKDAKYFRVNDGVSGGDYNYRSKITALYQGTEPIGGKAASSYKNYHNYFMITADDVNVSKSKAVTLTNWDGIPSGDNLNTVYSAANEIESDADYVYFAVPASGSGWGNHIYAYFYGGGNLRRDNRQRACYTVWPGLEPVSSEYTTYTNKGDTTGTDTHSDIYGYSYTGSLYDSSNTISTPTNPETTFSYTRDTSTYKVYKFRIPLGERRNYDHVIFNDGLSRYSAHDMETDVINYTPGFIYYADRSSDSHFESLTTDIYSSTRGDYLYIKMDSTTLGTWDDLHVTFYNASGTEILQSGTGYVMKYAGTKDSDTYFKIPVPDNAAKFSLNNGYSSYTTSNNTKTIGIEMSKKYDILPKVATATASGQTQGDMVYKLTGTTSAAASLELTAPTFTVTRTPTGSSTTTSEQSSHIDYSERGDTLYIKNTAGWTIGQHTSSAADSGGIITFYDAGGNSIAANVTPTDGNGTYYLIETEKDSNINWYHIKIPVGAETFTLTYNNGSTTTAKTPIFAKTTATTGTAENFTNGDMYYETQSGGSLGLLYPTFTGTPNATNYNDDNYSAGRRGDALYLICSDASEWNGMYVIFYDANGNTIKNNASTPTDHIHANYIGSLGAETDQASAVTGVTTAVEAAQGHWFRVYIPKGAVSFRAYSGTKQTAQGEIYELRSKAAIYRNDYTLGDMQYRIGNSASSGSYPLTMFYPMFTENPAGTVPGSDDTSSVLLANESATTVSPYTNAPVALTADDHTSTSANMPVLYPTSSNEIEYTWMEGSDNSGGWSDKKIYFVDKFGWDDSTHDIFAYFWNYGDGSNTTFVKMDSNGTSGGYTKYSCILPNQTETQGVSVIFCKHSSSATDISGNSGQTADLPLTSYPYGHGKIFTPQSYTYTHVYFDRSTIGATGNISAGGSTTNGTWYKDDLTTVGGSNNNVYQVKVPSDATSIYFRDRENESTMKTGTMTISSLSSVAGKLYGCSSNNSALYEITNHSYTLSSGNVSGEWSGTAATYTSSTPSVAYVYSYQPEDRYSLIASDGITARTDADDFIKIILPSSITKPYIKFYSDTSGSTYINTDTSSNKSTKGLLLNPDNTSGTGANNLTLNSTAYTCLYASDTNNTYMVRLPKNAKSFIINNGTSDLGSAIPLYENFATTNNGGSVTINNYHHAGTTFTIDSTGAVTSKARRTSTVEKSAITYPLTYKTDKDYIYFTDIGNTLKGSVSTLYAYYFGGFDGAYFNSSSTHYTDTDNTSWCGVHAQTTYTDNSGNTVYVFQPPTSDNGNYPYVIFNNGGYSSSTTNITEAVQYVLGKNYTTNGTATTGYGETTVAARTYQVQEVSGASPKTTDATISYSTTGTNGQYLYFVDNGTYDFGLLGGRYTLDDLHITFFADDKGTLPIGTASPGYKMDKINSNVYRITIPNGANYFQINNGQQKTSGTTNNNYRQSVIQQLAANGIYQFVTETDTDKVWACGDNTAVPTDITQLDDYKYYLKLNNPITNAEEEVAPKATSEYIWLATVVTGDGGTQEYIKNLRTVNGEVDKTYLDHTTTDIYDPINDIGNKVTTVKVVKKGNYYWKETVAPSGYKITTEITEFSVTGSVEVTSTVYDEAVTGEVILTKTAKEKVGSTEIGTALAGAKFQLLKINNGTEVDTLRFTKGSATGTTEYSLSGSGSENVTDHWLTTGTAGKLKITGLQPGDYCLVEQEAPANYSAKDSNTGANKRVYFSVGDNTVTKNITMSDEMDAAYIRLFEHINEKLDAWGDPTFIFKITNKGTGKTNLVSLTVNDDGTITDNTHKVLKWIDDTTEKFFTEDPINNTLYGNWLVEATSETEYKGMYHIDSQGRIRVEPGNYEISRMPVSRYKFVTSGNLVYTTNTEPTGTYTINDTGTEATEIFTLTAGQTSDVHYYDEVEYYDKFSHVDEQINKFYKLENGANKTIKGIRIEDKKLTETSGSKSITGSDLTVYAVYADGTEGELNSTEKAKITFSYTAAEGDTSTFTYTRTNENKTLNVNDVTDYKNKVYTITATYDSKFTTTFDLVFARS